MLGKQFRVIHAVQLTEERREFTVQILDLLLILQHPHQRPQTVIFHFAVFGSADEYQAVQQTQNGFVNLRR